MHQGENHTAELSVLSRNVAKQVFGSVLTYLEAPILTLLQLNSNQFS